MQNLGEVLQAARKKLNITQKELGQLTGISVVSIIKYEKSKALPSIVRLSKIAKVLELNYDEVCNILLEEKAKKRQ